MAESSPDISDLVNEYADVTLDQLESVEATLLAMEDGNTDSKLMLDLKRTIHSIKGSSGSFGLQYGTTICHAMEDKIDQPNTLDFYSNLLKFNDLLKKYFTLVKTPDDDALNEIKQEVVKLEIHSKDISHKALLIDPSRSFRKIVRRNLEEIGISVSESTDGYEALGRILREDFDSVIASKYIGLITGRQLLKSIDIFQDENNKIKSILVTSKSEASSHSELPNTLYLSKNLETGAKLKDIYSQWLNPDNAENSTENETDPIRKIVYIDDDPLMHKIVSIGINRASNVDLVTSLDASKGTEIVQAEKPDLILLDVIMGEISGEDVLSQLIELGIKTPVIFVTGKSNSKEHKRLVALGAIGVISKPVRPAKLYGEILKIWSSRKT
jgi:two-component system, OmpR family, response regulator